MAGTPLAHGEDDGFERAPPGREGVLDLGRHDRENFAVHDAVALELPQLLREHALGDLRQDLSDFAEAFFPADEMEQDDAFPATAQNIERDFDRAARRRKVVLRLFHGI